MGQIRALLKVHKEMCAADKSQTVLTQEGKHDEFAAKPAALVGKLSLTNRGQGQCKAFSLVLSTHTMFFLISKLSCNT